ncbi:hypothetical protein COF68_04685 [Bacillus toyonensis]|uniref:hypothetical protein n=1 Tax=Bacillus toyonensis TaxID=155322 RepID=UPI000BFB4CAB|nr:hypothetical protein [Bacillus toyonensis]PHE64148.1 hypothetical protein COF68_04685 [Bacillus toyonensis]
MLETLLIVIVVGVMFVLMIKFIKTVIARVIAIGLSVFLIWLSFNYIIPEQLDNLDEGQVKTAHKLAETHNNVRVVEADGKVQIQVSINKNWYNIKDVKIEGKPSSKDILISVKGEKYKVEDSELKMILETLK